jgi:hypothetical protein
MRLPWINLFTSAEEDYAIIFSSTFDSMPHKNRNGWGLHATDRRKEITCAAQQVAIRLSTSWAPGNFYAKYCKS